jgi:hypothetical protein
MPKLTDAAVKKYTPRTERLRFAMHWRPRFI